jgi:hypothetical protein
LLGTAFVRGVILSPMIKVNDWVVLKNLPPWVEQLPEESQEVFRLCVGRTYQVVEIDQNGLFVLDVREVDEIVGGFMNEIRVEETYLMLAKRQPSQS